MNNKNNHNSKAELSYPLYEDKNIESQIPDYSQNIPPPKTYKTLNEPVSETIIRDLSLIGFKLKAVLLPCLREEAKRELRKWDLWGPLLLCMMLAFVLSGQNAQAAQVIFATVFVLIWAGAFILTLNARFLGGKISIFQSVCVLGYCIFPMNIGALVLLIAKIFVSLPGYIKLIICGVAFFWACTSSLGFMGAMVKDDRRMLAVYPVILFYLYLSWFVFIGSY